MGRGKACPIAFKTQFSGTCDVSFIKREIWQAYWISSKIPLLSFKDLQPTQPLHVKFICCSEACFQHSFDTYFSAIFVFHREIMPYHWQETVRVSTQVLWSSREPKPYGNSRHEIKVVLEATRKQEFTAEVLLWKWLFHNNMNQFTSTKGSGWQFGAVTRCGHIL